MKQNSKLWLSAVLTFIVGFAIGCFVNFNGSSGDDLRADIGKLNRYKKEVISQNSQVILDQLNSDEDFKNQTLSALAIVAAHAGEFRANTAMSLEALEAQSDLEETKLMMQRVQQLSQNAASNAFTALAVVDAALQGEPLDVEEPLSGALLSFMILGKNAYVAKQYVMDVDQFLKGKDQDQYEDLVFTRDSWLGYGAMDAYLNGDDESLAYWGKLSALMPASEATDYFKTLSDARRADLVLAAHLGQAVQDGMGYVSNFGGLFNAEIAKSLEAASGFEVLQVVSSGSAPIMSVARAAEHLGSTAAALASSIQATGGLNLADQIGAVLYGQAAPGGAQLNSNIQGSSNGNL